MAKEQPIIKIGNVTFTFKSKLHYDTFKRSVKAGVVSYKVDEPIKKAKPAPAPASKKKDDAAE